PGAFSLIVELHDPLTHGHGYSFHALTLLQSLPIRYIFYGNAQILSTSSGVTTIRSGNTRAR
ncbi:MAG: hypothetical protein WCS94_15065, partial [Verrucomicrobiota bacterium]